MPIRDVFYYGKKPNAHPRERFARDLADARQQSTTEHFWIINEFCDYRGFDWDFDFDFLPDEDVWAEKHNNVWPSQHQKDSGTWLCSKEYSDLVVYRQDVDPVIRKNIKSECWILRDLIDQTKFDFSWHPDPTDPPYIYIFPTVWNNVGGPEYHTRDATEKKYITSQIGVTLPDMSKWFIPDNVDITDFNFTWVPHPDDPPYIYEFGTQHQKTGGPQYIVKGATEKKYVDLQKAKALATKEHWVVPNNIDISDFDFSWHPDNTDPLYIYQFGTQWALTGGPKYIMPDATEIKYMDNMIATALPDKTHWDIPAFIDIDSFDFSWHPYAEDEPYIYQFGTQWQKTGGPRYITPGTHKNSPISYVDTRILKAKRLPNKNAFAILDNLKIKDFDYSWHPDTTEEPYIYIFGNNHYSAEIMPTIEYAVPGAKQVKYIHDLIATLDVDMTNWDIPKDIDTTEFDFSWKPNPKDPLYIYEFGTQWQKTGGPKYVLEGATEKKYVDFQKVKSLPTTKNWEIPEKIRIESFDYSWHPDSSEQPYIYQFGTQWQMTGGPRYVVPNAIGTKYIDPDELHAIAAVDMSVWNVPFDIDKNSFDFSWHPHPDDPDFIYQFGTQWQKTGGPTYIPNVSDSEMLPTKYIDTRILKATKLPLNKNMFTILNGYKIKDFDYSWHPDDTEEPFIYVFGNNQYPAELMPTIEYRVPKATQKKYLTDVVAVLDVDMSNWEVPKNIDVTDFDFSWRPDPNDPPYIYQFGTQWQKTGGPRYVVNGAIEVKYVDSKAKSLPSKEKFTILNNYKIKNFDYSWHPDDTEEPFIYVFGNNQYPAEIMPTIEYRMGGATQVKYISNIVATLADDMSNWEVPKNINATEFDFSWRPNPKDPPFIYQFGTQWQKTGGPRYVVNGATEIKYVDTQVAKITPSRKNWEIPANLDVSHFDFSWHPDETGPKYIYQFGTLLDDVHLKDGPRYITPDNNGEVVYLENVFVKGNIGYPKYYIQTTLEDLIAEHKNEIFWALRENIDYTEFDFNWTPTKEQAFNINVFGSAESEATQTYFVNSNFYYQGHTGKTYIENKKIEEMDLSKVFVKPNMFLVDRGNIEAQQRFEQLKARYPDIQKTRYLNTWVDTITRCVNRSSTELCWILNSELDYSNFNFDYYPNPWQMKMVHVFGTQWSHWGTTFMVNRETFAQDTKYIKIIEHLSNLNFIKDTRAVATCNLYDIAVIDHGNKETAIVLDLLKNKSQGKEVTAISYEKSYLDTIRKLIDKLTPKKEHYLWICSSVCDYKNFDFTYICDPFAKDHLHVFPSDKQKFGDTFLIDVNKTREQIKEIDTLQSYHKVNYNQHQRLKRLPAPVFKTTEDTHVNSIKNQFDFPYAVFTTEDFVTEDIEPMSLWSEDVKDILITSTGATRIIVPKEARDVVKTELYDYPYIKTASRLLDSKPLDIVYLSNGEKNADENYEHLLKVTRGLKNRIVRVDGVNGRVQAYHAASTASETPWAFTVFAKLKVHNKFDFSWQPDRLQIPKHYIFHAKNPVNGLEYGHQGMIAYNKKLVLANTGKGLDFTLDDPHETVPLLSGVANFNTDTFSTWRTAFREVLKLKSDYTDISQERLNIWLTTAQGDFSEYSLSGAKDAIEYYESVAGDIDQLKLSYEWKWLREFFDKRYK